MSKPQARMGDKTTHGGVIVTGAERTFINGKPAARMGDVHVCPMPFHGITPIVTGDENVLIEGKPAARMGDITACGAVIATGSEDTM